jgi:uncharacterized protein (TIGR04255 family)
MPKVVNLIGDTTAREGPAAPLCIPSAKRVQYERNLIALVVCEVRFPYLVDYEDKLPRPLQKNLRKDYPHYTIGANLDVDAGSPSVTKRQRYLFRSRDRNWVVSFGPSTLSLETTNYLNFQDFQQRLESVLLAARSVLDTEFFTRLGLRYINHLPIKQGSFNGLLNPQLAPALVNGAFGDVALHETKVRGFCPGGKYTFRHGFYPDENPDVYVLDADFSVENIEYSELRGRLVQFNATNFNLFEWAIGEKAREAMGKTSPKAEDLP